MPEARKQFTFYRSYYEAIQELGKKDQAAIILAVCAYALYEEEPKGLSPSASTAFKLIRPTLDSARRKAEGGRQGGMASKAEGKTKDTASKPKGKGKQTASEKEKEKEKEKETETEKSGQGNPEQDFGSMWEEYPQGRRGNRIQAMELFLMEICSPEDFDKAMANLKLWKQSEQWNKENGRFIPYLDNWLSKGVWATEPPDAYKYKPRELSPDELEAIRRMMEEDW